MINAFNGTPFVGYASLANGSLGPTAFTLFVNGASYALQTGDRIYLTNITLSSNDGTQALITVDGGSASARKYASTYLSSTQPPASVTIPAGVGQLQPGQTPRATASAVTAAKTVECVINGYISKT